MCEMCDDHGGVAVGWIGGEFTIVLCPCGRMLDQDYFQILAASGHSIDRTRPMNVNWDDPRESHASAGREGER